MTNLEVDELFDKANQLEELGDLEAALVIRKQLVTRLPDDKVLSITLAKALEDLNDLIGAEMYYKKTVKLAPKWELASLQLFHFLFDNYGGRWKKDRLDEAFDEMRRFQSISHCEDYVEIVREINEKYGTNEK
ncbi:MAG: hypothetical protein ABJN69_06385 [Hellea sp.]